MQILKRFGKEQIQEFFMNFFNLFVQVLEWPFNVQEQFKN